MAGRDYDNEIKRIQAEKEQDARDRRKADDAARQRAYWKGHVMPVLGFLALVALYIIIAGK